MKRVKNDCGTINTLENNIFLCYKKPMFEVKRQRPLKKGKNI